MSRERSVRFGREGVEWQDQGVEQGQGAVSFGNKDCGGSGVLGTGGQVVANRREVGCERMGAWKGDKDLSEWLMGGKQRGSP